MARAHTAAAFALAALVAAPLARADTWWRRAAASLAVGVAFDQPVGEVTPQAHDVLAFDLALRGVLARSAGWAGGFDLRLGGAFGGGFVYGTHLAPLGAGVRWGTEGFAALLVGVGVGGDTGGVTGALELPVDLHAVVDVSERVRLVARIRALWVPSGARAGGAPDLALVDAASAQVGVRFGARRRYGSSSMSDGYLVALGVEERAGARIVGVWLGVELAAGTGRDDAQDDD